MSNESVDLDSENPNPEKEKDDQTNEPSELLEFVQQFNEDKLDDEDGDDAETPGKAKPKTTPKDLKGLAETLGIEVKDLYALQVPSSREGAEPFTLGKLKDLAAQEDDFALRNLRFDENRRRSENDLLRGQQELQMLMSALPKDAVSEKVMKAVREKRERYLTAERQKTLEVIGDWKGNDELERTERAAMQEHLAEYGFAENFLDTIADSKTLRYIRENYLRDARLKKVLESVKERKPAALGKSKPKGEKTRRAPRASSDDSQISGFLKAITT